MLVASPSQTIQHPRAQPLTLQLIFHGLDPKGLILCPHKDWKQSCQALGLFPRRKY